MEQKKTYSINEVLGCVAHRRKGRRKFDGDFVNLSTQKLILFKRIWQAAGAIVCVRCGAKGEFFVKERSGPKSPYYMTLYAKKDGNDVEMTQDHVVPTSKGGSPGLSNTQPMCVVCNNQKGDKVEPQKKLKKAELEKKLQVIEDKARGWKAHITGLEKRIKETAELLYERTGENKKLQKEVAVLRARVKQLATLLSEPVILDGNIGS